MKDNTMHFSIGEFAKICQTTKDTLFHYDKIDLLKPCRTTDKGYRYYNLYQYFTFDLISVLKSAGASLQEIKSYLTHQNPDEFIAILKEKQDFLAHKKKEIESMQALLGYAMDITQFALDAPIFKPYIEYCEATSYVITPLNPTSTSIVEKEHIIKTQEHLAYCRQHNLGEPFAVGCIVTNEDLKRHRFIESYYYSTHDALSPSLDHFYLRPAGYYAIIVHHGSYSTIDQSFLQLEAYIKQQKLTICGNSYSDDLINYFASQTDENFLTKISIHVKPMDT